MTLIFVKMVVGCKKKAASFDAAYQAQTLAVLVFLEPTHTAVVKSTLSNFSLNALLLCYCEKLTPGVIVVISLMFRVGRWIICSFSIICFDGISSCFIKGMVTPKYMGIHSVN